MTFFSRFTSSQSSNILRFPLLYRVDNKSGCRFLTVDAYADAVPFYLKNGFVPHNDDDKDDETRLLYFDLNDVSRE